MVLLPFCRWFESQDLDYLREAEARLKEVHALPGPIFTVGLSMGGAVSLALAAAHPDKIAKTAVFSPLLKVENQQNRVFCILAGPLGAQESGWYPDMPFSLGCFVAVDAFGHFVRSNNNHVNVLAKIPTFVVLTEIDDSADVTAAEKFITGLRSCAGIGGPPHLSSIYPTSENVPHPMVDPTEVKVACWSPSPVCIISGFQPSLILHQMCCIPASVVWFWKCTTITTTGKLMVV
jgi:pimeloyl-ACP methyl ester carboxylesterase